MKCAGLHRHDKMPEENSKNGKFIPTSVFRDSPLRLVVPLLKAFAVADSHGREHTVEQTFLPLTGWGSEKESNGHTQNNVFDLHMPVIYLCQLDPYSWSPFGTGFLSGLTHWGKERPLNPISAQPQTTLSTRQPTNEQLRDISCINLTGAFAIRVCVQLYLKVLALLLHFVFI